MPVWLAARRQPDDASVYQKKLLPDPERARFVLEHLLQGLGRTLDAFAPSAAATSAWTGYMQGGNNYTAEQFQAKERFVAEFLAEHAPQRVLDVGCNTGHFSFLAARSGASVVAIDYDPAAAGSVWRTGPRGKARRAAAGGEPGAAHSRHGLEQSRVAVLSRSRPRRV